VHRKAEEPLTGAALLVTQIGSGPHCEPFLSREAQNRPFSPLWATGSCGTFSRRVPRSVNRHSWVESYLLGFQ
jgi:hypothetical protein